MDVFCGQKHGRNLVSGRKLCGRSTTGTRTVCYDLCKIKKGEENEDPTDGPPGSSGRSASVDLAWASQAVTLYAPCPFLLHQNRPHISLALSLVLKHVEREPQGEGIWRDPGRSERIPELSASSSTMSHQPFEGFSPLLHQSLQRQMHQKGKEDMMI